MDKLPAKIPVVILMVCLVMLVSCASRRAAKTIPKGDETPAGPLFDPLETSVDREVVPETYPIHMAAFPEAGDSLKRPMNMTYSEFDSASASTGPSEVYRVQIFTSRLYTEANSERSLAEEIFNLPIYLDYELPYYKLRVGDFLTRPEAETMLSEIKSIGYRNAWVARVVLKIKESPEHEPTDQPILPLMPSDSMPGLTDTTNQVDGSREP
jgi:hypothetical protein